MIFFFSFPFFFLGVDCESETATTSPTASAAPRSTTHSVGLHVYGDGPQAPTLVGGRLASGFPLRRPVLRAQHVPPVQIHPPFLPSSSSPSAPPLFRLWLPFSSSPPRRPSGPWIGLLSPLQAGKEPLPLVASMDSLAPSVSGRIESVRRCEPSNRFVSGAAAE